MLGGVVHSRLNFAGVLAQEVADRISGLLTKFEAMHTEVGRGYIFRIIHKIVSDNMDGFDQVPSVYSLYLKLILLMNL